MQYCFQTAPAAGAAAATINDDALLLPASPSLSRLTLEDVGTLAGSSGAIPVAAVAVREEDQE